MVEFNEKELQEILQKDSKTLCTMIIANRILGCYKKEYKQCMIELMKRRAAGDDFKFEEYIKESIEKNKIKFNIPNIKQMKQQVTSSIIQSIIDNNIGNIGEDLDSIEDLFGED